MITHSRMLTKWVSVIALAVTVGCIALKVVGLFGAVPLVVGMVASGVLVVLGFARFRAGPRLVNTLPYPVTAGLLGLAILPPNSVPIPVWFGIAFAAVVSVAVENTYERAVRRMQVESS